MDWTSKSTASLWNPYDLDQNSTSQTYASMGILGIEISKRSHPCLTSFTWYSGRACFLAPRPMCASAKSCEATMAEAFIGLIVALGLGAYLVHALLHPEKY